MTQNDVLSKLKELRLNGDNSFYSAEDIHKMLGKICLIVSIRSSLRQLNKYRCIEFDHEEVIKSALLHKRFSYKYRFRI